MAPTEAMEGTKNKIRSPSPKGKGTLLISHCLRQYCDINNKIISFFNKYFPSQFFDLG
jgi:hypothetical protein